MDFNFGKMWNAAAPYVGRALLAVVILAVGIALAHAVRILIVRAMRRGRADPIVGRFVSSLAYAAVLAIVAAACMGELGVQTASIVAIIGAMGIAIGLALQNSLANLASGMLLVALKPFSAGDYIEASESAGTVVEVGLFATTLRTIDGIKVVLPNSKLTDGSIVNYSTHPERRFDTSVSISYSADLQSARKLLLDMFASDGRILNTPAPIVSVDSLADSGVVLGIRVWANASDYWDVRFGLLGDIKATLDKAGIEIPFPQRVVHIRGGNADTPLRA